MKINVSTKKYPNKFAFIDVSDAENIRSYGKWSFDGRYVAKIHKETRKKIYLHRIIMGITDNSLIVDHINHDKLDNRRKNLRVCSQKENAFNRSKTKSKTTSQFKGVAFDINRKKWKAAIGHPPINLGRFDSENMAAAVYNYAAQCLHKDFAYLNKTDVKLSETVKNHIKYRVIPHNCVGYCQICNKEQKLDDSGICELCWAVKLPRPNVKFNETETRQGIVKKKRQVKHKVNIKTGKNVNLNGQKSLF